MTNTADESRVAQATTDCARFTLSHDQQAEINEWTSEHHKEGECRDGNPRYEILFSYPIEIVDGCGFPIRVKCVGCGDHMNLSVNRANQDDVSQLSSISPGRARIPSFGDK